MDIEAFRIYSGPLVLKFKLDKKQLNEVNKLCKKDSKKDFRKQLAGIIKHEYQINEKKYHKIIEPYLKAYKHMHQEYHNVVIEKDIYCTSAWVNYMYAGEYNPPHIHNSCNFSSVLFLKISNELKKERKHFVGTASKPGSLIFTFINPSAKHHINEYDTEIIEEGDFYIFPYNVQHSVNAFKSKGERITVACNFDYE